jgi:hypothetical protein
MQEQEDWQAQVIVVSCELLFVVSGRVQGRDKKKMTSTGNGYNRRGRAFEVDGCGRKEKEWLVPKDTIGSKGAFKVGGCGGIKKKQIGEYRKIFEGARAHSR